MILRKLLFVIFILNVSICCISAQSDAEKATRSTNTIQAKTNFSDDVYAKVYDANMVFITAVNNLGSPPERGTEERTLWQNAYNAIVAKRKSTFESILTEQEMNLLLKGARGLK